MIIGKFPVTRAMPGHAYRGLRLSSAEWYHRMSRCTLPPLMRGRSLTVANSRDSTAAITADPQLFEVPYTCLVASYMRDAPFLKRSAGRPGDCRPALLPVFGGKIRPELTLLNLHIPFLIVDRVLDHGGLPRQICTHYSFELRCTDEPAVLTPFGPQAARQTTLELTELENALDRAGRAPL